MSREPVERNPEPELFGGGCRRTDFLLPEALLNGAGRKSAGTGFLGVQSGLHVELFTISFGMARDAPFKWYEK